MKNRRNFGMFFFILLGLVLAALSAHAQTNFWWTNGQSAAQGYNWSTNADWTNNSANGNAPLLGGATNYIVNFANGGGVYTVTNDLGANGYGFLLNQLAFSNDAVTLAGDNLVFSRGMALPQVLQNGASNIVFNAGMILATNLTFGGAGTGGITVNSGILGAASLIMNGTNYSLTLTGNNAYTGGTIVNTGAVVMTGNNNFGAGVITVNGGSLTTTGTNTTTGATTVGTGGVAIFGGLNNLGAVTVNAGTLTFAAGSSNNLGLMTVSGGAAGGTLVVNGVTLATNGSTTAIIGAANLDRSTLIINTNLSAYKMNIGNVAGAAGAVIQNGGTVLMGTNLTSQAVLNVGNTGGGYGYYQMNGGVLIVGQLGVGGSGGSNLGVLDLNGGTVAANDYILINYGGNSTGVLNIASGRVTSPSTHPFYMSWGSGGNFGMVNIFSNGVLDVTANGTLQMMQTASTGPGSVINLNTGGLLMAKAIAQAAAGNTYFNFNGGTLQAGGASTTFLQGLSNAVIYAGGATIDSSNFNITINQNLLAPTGTGVTSVALLSNGGGYIGAPVVTISGGGGTGATAIAQVDLNTNDVATYGKVTNILVTSYGVGYSSTPTVTLSGGGYLSAATINSSLIGLTLNNTNGGLTKLGAGTLTLGGTNTYTGATTLNAGELSIGSYTNIPLNNTINFNGGIMQITGTTITNLNPYAVNWSSFNGGIDVSSSANTVTITNNIYGSGSFTKLGQGTNVLTGSNTFSGLTTLNSGYLLLSNSTGATAIGGNLSVLRTTSSIGQAQALMAGTNQLPSTAIVTLQQATTNTGDARFALQGFSQTIGGLIGLQVGGGTTNLIVEAATDNSTNKPATLTINVAAGSNYAYQGYMRDAAGGPNSLLSVVKDGLGTQSLGGTTVTYTGPTTIRNGTLVLSNATAFASAALTNNGNLTFWLDTGNSETYGINIAGSNGFTKAGAGTLTIGANNTFTNGLTVAGGQLTIGNVDGSFGAAPLAPVTNITFAGNGGVIAAGTGFTINSNRIIWLSGSSSTGTFDVASGQTLYISEQITGPGTLAKQNTGTLYLSNTAILVNATYSNNFTGGVVINAGTIRLANASALGTPSVGSLLTIGTIVGQTYGGALDMNTNRQDLIYTNTTLNSFGTAYNYGALQNGSGSTDMGATGVRNVTLLGSSAIGQDNGKNFSILGVINGNGNYLAKVGNAAMYTFSNLNNIAGLYVNSGTIGIEVINPSNVPLIQVNFGGTLQLYGRTLTNTTTLVMNGGYLSDSGANLIQGQVIMQAPTNAINNASMMTMGGGVSGPGGIMKYNTGTLILTNASYSGVTLIDQGVVEFAGNTAPTTAGSIYINDGGWAAFLRTGGMTYQGTVNSYMGILGYSQNGGAMAVTGLYTTVAGWLNSGLINPSSGGALALMVNSSENINMSAGAGYTNLSLGAMTGSTLNYTGTLTPFGTTYRIGGGGGTLIMVNTNALTGAGMNVVSGMGNGGTVILASSNDASGQATVVAGTTLQLGAGLANGWLATPTIVDNGTLIFNRSDIVTNLAAISGNGALTTIGKGALVINTAQAYAGNTTVGSNSTLRLTGNGMLGANGLGAGDFNMGNVGGLTATAIVDSATAGWTGMTFRVGNAGNGYLALTGGVINAMAGFVMGNANTTTTRVDMAGGTLNVNTFNSGTIQNMVIGNGTGTNTLNINGGQINLYNGASLQMGNAAGANGVVVQSNGIVNIANGSLVLGNSTSTGQYYLAGGTLIASNITRNNGYGGLIFNGGTLQAAGNNGNWISNLSTAIVAGVAIMDSSNYTVTVSNNLTGSGATQWLAKQGVGTLVLAGTNTLAGGIAINAGLVVYSSSNSIAGTITNNASGAVAFGFTNDISSVLANCVLASSAGAIALLGTNANSNVSFASMPNAFLGAATNLTYGGNFTPNGTTYQLGGGGAVLVYTNVIGAGSNLVIGGYMPGSAVSLTANNANDGTVTLSGGVLRAVDGVGLSTAANLVLNGGVFETTGTFSRTLGMAANNIQVVGNVSGFSANGAPATINLNGGGTLQWGGVNFNPTALVLNEITANTNLTFANGLDFDGADRTVNVNATNANSTATISGALINNGGGTAGLIKGGAGTLNLTAAGSYNGNTTINAGTLQVSGSDNVLPTSTTLTLANVSGATFILSNQNQAVAGLTGGGALGGNVQLVGSGTLMVNTAGANQYSGALTGSGNLTMAGAGTLTLANNTNNLSGLTTVRSGTLALTNVSLAGAVNVAAGATLAVNGAIQQGALLGQYYNVAAPNYGPFNSNSPASMLTAFAASNIAFTAVSSVMGPAIDGGRDTAAGYSQGAFIPGPWSPLGTGSRLINQQVIWTGKYNAPTSGKYYFDANADDECAVWIDGVLVVKATGNGFQSNPYVGTVNLAAGLHDIVIAYANGVGNYGFFVDVAQPGGTTNRLLNSAMSYGTLASIGSLSGAQGSTLAINNAYLTITQTLNSTFAGNITGLAGDTLTKMGSGTLTLSGTNSYGAGTIVAGGTLVISGTNAMPGTGLISVTTNGVLALDYTGIQNTLGTRIDSSVAGVLALTPTSANELLDFSAAGANMANAFLGAISNVNYTGTFTPYGSAVANTYVPYTINNYSMTSTNFYRFGGGGATLTNANALVNPYSLMLMANSSVALGSVATYNLAGGLNISTNTLLDLNGTSLTGPLSGVGTITNSGAALATLTVGQDNAAYTPGIVFGGNLNLTKNGSGIWSITNNNSFTGGFTLNSGYFTNAAPSGSTPIGSGNVLLNGGTLVFAPQANTTNITANFAAANNVAGSTFTYGSGISALVVNQGTWTNLALTLGNSAAAANSVFQRSGYGAIIIAANSGMTNLGFKEQVFINGGVAVNNGMVNPTILGRNNDANANLDFLTYASGVGFTNVTYSDTNFFAANNTVIELVNGTYTNYSASAAVYALKMTNGVTMTLSNQMTIGNGAGQAGLILDGGTIAGSSNLMFGAAEGVIAVSRAGGSINAPITGSAGITVIANETLSSGTLGLGGTNIYTGGTRIEGARLSLSNPKQLGYGDVWIYGDYNGGGQLFLNATMTLTNNMHLSGIGAQTDTTPYGAIRFNNSGAQTNIFTGTIELMGDTRLDFGNAAGVATFSNLVYGTGRLMLGANNAGQLSMTYSNTYSGPTELDKGTLRAVDGVGLSPNSLLILNGGTFETGTNFNRTLGFGPGQIRFQSATDGLSANTNLGGNAGAVVFSLNAPGSVVVWGTNNFNPSTLMLNDAYANTSLILSNSLDLNGAARTISVGASAYGLTSTVANAIINSGTPATLTKNGVGVLVLAGTNSGFGVTISAGILRADLGIGIPTNTAPLVLNGGVWETHGLINASLGGQPGQIQFNQNVLGGFSAYGSPVTVNLDRGTTLVWQANSYFNPSALSLQEVSANTSLTFLNNIDLAGEAHTITVNNTNANLAPIISGTINSAGTLWNSILTKNGAGTLVLTGTNTYGSTIVSAGILRADQGVGMATNGLITLAGGIWESDANITLAVGSNYVGNTIQLTTGNTGFNAVTNPITINLTNGAPLVWGTNYFNPGQLVFNNANTPGQTNITFLGVIDINGGQRSINVGSGTVTLAYGLINGVTTNVPNGGIGGLYKYGAGTLVVSNQGALVVNGNYGLDVHMGTLVLASGSLVSQAYGANNNDVIGDVAGDVATLTLMGNSTYSRSNNTLYVGNSTGSKGTLNIQDNARFYNSYRTTIAPNAGSTGIVNQTGGLFMNGNDTYLGGNGGYGYYNLYGGVISNQYTYIGNSGIGIMTMTNGVFSGNTTILGNGATAVGAWYQSGGLYSGTGELKLGTVAGGYGYYQLSGGVTSNNNWESASRDTGLGVLYQSGGTNVITGSGLIVSTGSGTGVVYLTGGLMNLNNNPIEIGFNNIINGRGEMTVANNAQVISTNYLIMNRSNAAITNSTGFLNLNGGVLQVNGIIKGTNFGYSVVNFNGGTLRASANNVALLGVSTGQVDAAYVWNGGAFIDTATNTVTVMQNLITPAVAGGSGVVSIAFANIGGFIGAPYVAINGNGTGAMAVAQFDNTQNAVTNILIVNPGVGYTATPTFTLMGGGSTNVPLTGLVSMATNASGALTKSGSGMLLLSGTNSYTGGTLINSGVVQFASAYAIPSLNSITINSGGALAVAGAQSNVTDWLNSGYIVSGASGAMALTSNSVSENINMASWPTLSLGAAIGSNVTYTGTLTPAGSTYYVGGGGGTIVFTNVNALTGVGNNVVAGNGGGGVVILQTNNNYTGGTLINAGTLQIGASNAATAWFGSSGNITNNGTLLINNTDGLVLNQTISGNGILYKSGNGTTTLNAANSFSGGTIITNGTILVQNSYGLGAVSGAVTIYGSGGSSNYTMQLANNITVSNAITLIGTTAGRTRLANISGSNTLAGAITIGSVSLNPISFDSNSGFLTLAGNISGNTFTVRGNSNGAILGSVAINADLQKTDNGRWLIGAAGQTYSWSNTADNVGTLQMGAANVLPSATVLTMGQGDTSTVIFDLNGFNQTVGGLVLNTTGGTKIITNSSATQATFTISNLTTSTYGGLFGGNLALTVAGSGKVTLSGANTHYGDTLMQAGTLVVSNQLALQNSTLNYVGGYVQFGLGMGTNVFGGLAGTANLALTNSGSGIVLFVGNNNSNAAYSGSLSDAPYALGSLTKIGSGTQVLSGSNTYNGGTLVSNGTLQLGDGTARNGYVQGNISNDSQLVFANPLDQIYSGTISGAGTLTKSAAGVLTLTAANTYAGNTTISNGTLRLGINNALPATSVYAGAAGNLDLAGFNQLLTGVDGYLGVVTNSGVASTLTVNLTTTQNFGGTLAGPANFTVQGGGRLYVSGSSSPSYTGNVIVSNATVLVQGTLTTGGLIQVFNGGTLGGTGALGNVQVNSGGTYSPGFSPGTQLVVSLTLNGGLFNETIVSSNNYSRLVAANGFSLAAGTTNYLHLALSSYVFEGGASYLIVQDNSGTAWNGNQFVLSDALSPDNGLTLTNGATFLAVGEGSSTNLFRIAYTFDSVSGTTGSGNDILLTVIPEPTTANLLVLIGAAAGLRRLLRKRRRL